MIWALHGAFGDASDWETLAASLPTEVRPIDLWSTEHDLSLADWGAEFNRRVAGSDPEPILLGYSMGARLGLHALLDAPGLWRRAILVSPHPGLGSRDDRRARRARDDGWLRKFERLEWSEFWGEWNAQGVFESSVSRPLVTRRDSMRRGLVAWSLSEQGDLLPDLHRIGCPILWVTGGRDQKFTSIAEASCLLSPGAQHRVIESAGHRVPWDAPDEFAELVRDFSAL